jgi:hypothetical protein
MSMDSVCALGTRETGIPLEVYSFKLRLSHRLTQTDKTQFAVRLKFLARQDDCGKRTAVVALESTSATCSASIMFAGSIQVVSR